MSVMAPAHVPAWRRLGLKLKSEQLSEQSTGQPGAEAIVPTIETTPATKRRKLSLPLGIGDQIRNAQRATAPAVRSRAVDLNPTSKPNSSELPSKAGTVGETGLRSSLARSSSFEERTPSPRKRKSVSFTPDTKAADGGKSLKEMYIANPPDPASLFDAYSAEDVALEQSSSISANPKQEPAPAKKAKRGKKSKSTLISNSPDTEVNTSLGNSKPPAAKESAALGYLAQYSKSRSTWKFNKNKQNWLLAHALDIEKIGPSYDVALSQYIQGIESEMPRLRLFRSAQEIIEADDKVSQEESEALEQPATVSSSEDVLSTKKSALSTSPNDPEQDLYTDSARIADYKAAVQKLRSKIHAQEIAREEVALHKSDAFRRRLLKRKRAELVLRSADPQQYFRHQEKPKFPALQIPESTTSIRSSPVPTPHPSKNSTAMEVSNEPIRRGRRRKRRRWTGNSDDDTSSSSSDLASDSETAEAVATAVVKGGAVARNIVASLEKASRTVQAQGSANVRKKEKPSQPSVSSTSASGSQSDSSSSEDSSGDSRDSVRG